jgi:hypothetical protein
MRATLPTRSFTHLSTLILVLVPGYPHPATPSLRITPHPPKSPATQPQAPANACGPASQAHAANPPSSHKAIPRRIRWPEQRYHWPLQRSRQMQRPRVPRNHQPCSPRKRNQLGHIGRNRNCSSSTALTTACAVGSSSETAFTATRTLRRPFSAATAPYFRWVTVSPPTRRRTSSTNPRHPIPTDPASTHTPPGRFVQRKTPTVPDPTLRPRHHPATRTLAPQHALAIFTRSP